MGMHGRSGTGSENPIIDACAGIFGGDRGGNIGRRSDRALGGLNVQNFVRSSADVVNSMGVGGLRQGQGRNIAGFGGS